MVVPPWIPGEEREWDLFGPYYSEDLGETRMADPEVAGFDSFAALLTNGRDEYIEHTLQNGKSKGSRESILVDKNAPSYGRDFVG